MDAEEFARFKSVLLEKLPVTFRVNPGVIEYEKMTTMLRDPSFMEQYV